MAPLTLVALVLLTLVAGVLVGAWLGRSLTAGHDERELSRAREELANARAEVAVARREAAEARTAGALADADVAAAVAQRDAAVARAEEIAADRQAMVDQFRLLSNEVAERQGKAVDAVSEQRLQATEQLLAPVNQSLKEFQARLSEVEKERVAMATDLRAQVSTVRQAGEAMRREAATLVTALRKPQVRGSWGETTLKNVAQLAGMVERCDFDLQVTNQADGQRLRPDMRVNLADGKHVFVDSKVPLSAFLDAAETDDHDQQAAHLASFARHVRTHVDQLSSKQYWKAAESPEFVVLFLPSEAFFSAALDQMPDLYEYAIAKDVVLATPTTLIGMLRAISYGWKQAALAEKAREVFRLGRELHERLGQLGNRFDKLGRALNTTVNAYNETIGTVETRVLVSARRFRDLQVSERELASPERLEAPVRQIQAPELVDDATQVEPMVGRRSRRTPEPPEAETLWRSDPGVDELVEGDAERSPGPADERRQEA